MKQNTKVSLAIGIALIVIVSTVFQNRIGILAGIILDLLLLLKLKTFTKFKETFKNFNDFPATQQIRSVELPIDYKEAFALCELSLQQIGNTSIMERDLSEGIIKAKAGINLRTWGDAISFTITKSAPESTLIVVQSQPRLKTTIIDWGKNLENVEKISSFLKGYRYN